MHLSVSLFFQPSIDLSSYPWVYLDEFFGVQWITDAAARSCAMNDGCWYAIVRSEKTHTLACNDCRVLMCHRAVRKNTRWPATNSKCWCAIMRSEKTCLSVYLSIKFSLSLYIYISFSLSLPICLSVYLSVYVSTHLFLYLSWYLYNYLSLCLCIYLSISPSISLAISLTIYLSVCLSIYLFLYLSVCPSIYVSIYLSNYLSIYLYNFRTSKSGANMLCFVHFDLEMCFAPQRRALFQHPNLQKWREHVVFCTFWLGNVLRATTACTFSTSQLPKVVRTWCALYILTSKCASRHKGVHFFNISTSKSGPRMVCFVHFDFKMCFAPLRRALFRHLNFQKWSDHGVFCTFWLGNVLRATTACNFSSLIWPAGSAPAALASLLFDPPEPQIIGKTQCFATPTFSRICIFFLLTLSLLLFLFSLPLPCSAFHLSILSEVWLLNFLRSHSCLIK